MTETDTQRLLVCLHPRALWPGPLDPSDSVDAAHIENFLEYLDGSARITFMNQLSRVLKPGAKVHITVPYYSHPQAWANWALQWPPMSEHSFLFCSQTWRDQHPGTESLGYACDLETLSYEYDMVDDWTTRHDDARAFAIQHYLGVVPRLHITLIQPQRA